MKYQPLPIGVDNFEMIITRNYYYIDKTGLIKELLDKRGMVNLFTRPRRFGKTLNLSMIQFFFEDTRDFYGKKKDNKELFAGLTIMEAGEEYVAHMGQYPVINLSLKGGKQPDFQMACALMIREIADEYKRHYFILQGDMLEDERERYKRIAAEKATREEYADSIKFLSKCLYNYYGKKVIILIDEYDVPLENAFHRGFYEEMIDFIRSLFESALKTNDSLEFAVITGCLRISKESIFTGMNNLNIISILSNEYDEYFGFTEAEAKKICADFGLMEKYDIMKEWYNGYIFGDTNVYNPWSLISFVKDLLEDINQYPISYWANTSSNSIVRKLIEMADEDVKGEIETLISGKTLVKEIHEDITYDEVYETMNNLWNFMFFTGYFRKVRLWMNEEDKTFAQIAIPNREVRYIFNNKIIGWFKEQVKQRDRTRLFAAIVNKDPETMEEEIGDMLLETISYLDSHENFYHGFIAGILTGMSGYRVISNREGGKGRSDLFIKHGSRRKPAYIIEFKVAESIEQLDKKAEEALNQIDDRNYVRELNDDGYAVVVKYGIAFFGKDCVVRIG